jgi:hypothetical protein
VAFEGLETIPAGLLALHRAGRRRLSALVGIIVAAAAGRGMMIVELRMLIGPQVFIFLSHSRREFNGGLDVIGNGPIQPLLRGKTAAMAPALFRRNATTPVTLARKGSRARDGARYGPRGADHCHRVSQHQ